MSKVRCLPHPWTELINAMRLLLGQWVSPLGVDRVFAVLAAIAPPSRRADNVEDDSHHRPAAEQFFLIFISAKLFE
jgi:hypothetical protein